MYSPQICTVHTWEAKKVKSCLQTWHYHLPCQVPASLRLVQTMSPVFKNGQLPDCSSLLCRLPWKMKILLLWGRNTNRTINVISFLRSCELWFADTNSIIFCSKCLQLQKQNSLTSKKICHYSQTCIFIADEETVLTSENSLLGLGLSDLQQVD